MRAAALDVQDAACILRQYRVDLRDRAAIEAALIGLFTDRNGRRPRNFIARVIRCVAGR
jgi:hypothetical protein